MHPWSVFTAHGGGYRLFNGRTIDTDGLSANLFALLDQSKSLKNYSIFSMTPQTFFIKILCLITVAIVQQIKDKLVITSVRSVNCFQ